MQSLETDNHPMLCERRPLGPRAMYLACSPVGARLPPPLTASATRPSERVDSLARRLASPRSPHAHDPASRPPAPRSAVEHVSLSDGRAPLRSLLSASSGPCRRRSRRVGRRVAEPTAALAALAATMALSSAAAEAASAVAVSPKAAELIPRQAQLD